MDLKRIIENITCLDEKSMESARKRWASIAKPLNSLGLLEGAIVKIAGITQNPKIDLSKKAVVVMCADNGVVAEGVTQSGQEVTAIVAENLTKGITSVCTMGKVAGADIIPVDIGVKSPLDIKGIIQRKIKPGTDNMVKGPAMSREEAIEAILTGVEVVRLLKNKGYNLIGTGEMGIGNTTTSSAMTAVFLDVEVEEVTGRGAGLSSEGLNRKINAIKKAIEVNQPDKNDALDVLSKVGGLDIAGLTGVFLGGALYHVPILIDGFISSVAALTAVKLCPTVKDYLLPSHMSKEPATLKLIEYLGLDPFIKCNMCLGEGTGTVAVMPILEMAAAVYNNMSTFSEINVEEYKPLN